MSINTQDTKAMQHMLGDMCEFYIKVDTCKYVVSNFLNAFQLCFPLPFAVLLAFAFAVFSCTFLPPRVFFFLPLPLPFSEACMQNNTNTDQPTHNTRRTSRSTTAHTKQYATHTDRLVLALLLALALALALAFGLDTARNKQAPTPAQSTQTQQTPSRPTCNACHENIHATHVSGLALASRSLLALALASGRVLLSLHTRTGIANNIIVIDIINTYCYDAQYWYESWMHFCSLRAMASAALGGGVEGG
jgi:hypothetical protein